MTAHVISHHGAYRKRAQALAWRRLAVFALAALAVALATWLTPRLVEAPLPALAPTPMRDVAPAQTPPAPEPIALPEAAPSHPAARPRPVGPPPIPLNGQGALGDDYEVLNAEELDAISQARAEDGASQFAPAPQAATTAAEELAGARESVNVEDQSGQSRRRTRRR